MPETQGVLEKMQADSAEAVMGDGEGRSGEIMEIQPNHSSVGLVIIHPRDGVSLQTLPTKAEAVAFIIHTRGGVSLQILPTKAEAVALAQDPKESSPVEAS